LTLDISKFINKFRILVNNSKLTQYSKYDWYVSTTAKFLIKKIVRKLVKIFSDKDNSRWKSYANYLYSWITKNEFKFENYFSNFLKKLLIHEYGRQHEWSEQIHSK
jgi:hypothetical protein